MPESLDFVEKGFFSGGADFLVKALFAAFSSQTSSSCRSGDSASYDANLRYSPTCRMASTCHGPENFSDPSQKTLFQQNS
jgi:hypothetical protein